MSKENKRCGARRVGCGRRGERMEGMNDNPGSGGRRGIETRAK